MNKKETFLKYGQRPVDYPVCLNAGCNRAARCRHALAVNPDLAECPTLHVINPREYEGGECRHFCDFQSRQRMALGFVRQCEIMKARGLVQAFREACLRHMGRTIFYDKRAGVRETTPAEQAIIIRCAHSAGYDFPTDGWDQMVEVEGW